MVQLTRMWFAFIWDDITPTSVPSHAFAALTASSQLQDLHVDLRSNSPAAGLFGESAVVPGSDVLQHMFPSGRQLLHLEYLHLGCHPSCANWHVPAADVRRIASCCPRLHGLELHNLLDPATASDLSSLLRLTSCRDLSLAGEGIGSPAAPIVAQLTQLTTWSGSCV